MKDTTFTITTSTVIRIILLLTGAALLWHLRDLVLIVLTSIVIASAIEPASRTLVRYKIPRILSVIIVYLGFFGIFFVTIFFLLPPLFNETSSLFTSLPSYLKTIGAPNALSGDIISNTQTVVNGFSPGQISQDMDALVKGLSGNFFAAMSIMFGGVVSFILIVVFSFYFAISKEGIEDFLRVITPRKNEIYILDLWHRAKMKIGLWMQGQLLLGLLIGVMTYLGLSILGVKYALVLAVIAGIMELIPVFGPILSAVPAIAVAFSTSGLSFALIVGAMYVIIQQFENHLIYPLVVTKVVGVPPILVILALLIGFQLAGILGVLLAVPVAAAFQELFSDIEKARHSSEMANE